MKNQFAATNNPVGESSAIPLETNPMDDREHFENNSLDSVVLDSNTPHLEVSLRSIQLTSPIESYEETLLMQSLEDKDPTGSSFLNLQDATALPEDFDEQRPTLIRQHNSRNLQDPPTSRHRTRTLEEELFNLTKSINKAHAQSHSFIPLFENQEGKPRHRRLKTQQDFFASNAKTIFQNSGDDPAPDLTSNSSYESSSKNPSRDTHPKERKKHRRKHRRTSIHHGNSILEKAGNDAGKGIRDFGNFLKANRSYTYEYVRSVLFFWILPCTILAFILFYGFENPRFDGIIDDINNSANRTSTLPMATNTVAPNKGNKLPISSSSNEDASWSWWLLFSVRHVITFGIAKAIQFLVVSLAQKPPRTVHNGWFVPTLGPMVRLIILQEKGLPLQLQIWGILNFIVNYGRTNFAQHWMYFQDFLLIFTEENPSGGVTYAQGYRNLLLFSIIAGVAVAGKRFWVGLRFGKASYDRYAGKLTGVLEDIVDVTKIAKFAQQPKDPLSAFSSMSSMGSPAHHPKPTPVSQSMPICNLSASAIAKNTATINEWMGRSAWKQQNESETEDKDPENPTEEETSISPRQHLLLDLSEHQAITDSQRIKIDQLLGEWEDLDVAEKKADYPSLSSIVQFRASCQVLDSPVPFSQAFGYARNRFEVIECSQRLYQNLMEIQRYLEDLEFGRSERTSTTTGTGNEPTNPTSSKTRSCSIASYASAYTSSANEDYHPVLKFQTLALTLMDCKPKSQGDEHDTRVLDQLKAKKLINLFRPARNGDITLLEFCKSVDSIYKEMRKLRASIANEGRMNMASEKILNVIFYFILVWVGVAVIGINPLALLGFMGSVIISISFMVGGASSDYFRGLLFILVQRPYDIGDRINVNGIETDADPNGSPGWIVKDVTLYHTTVIYGTTQEYATYSNGALSKSRIINCARSPRAQLYFCMKFGVDVPHAIIEEFHNELKAYVKSKPREWLAFSAFRLNRVEADLGFVEYKILIQHRDSWQNVPALVTDLADVRQFAVNLSKTKGMDYRSPPLPVEMKFSGGSSEDFWRRQQESFRQQPPQQPRSQTSADHLV